MLGGRSRKKGCAQSCSPTSHVSASCSHRSGTPPPFRTNVKEEVGDLVADKRDRKTERETERDAERAGRSRKLLRLLASRRRRAEERTSSLAPTDGEHTDQRFFSRSAQTRHGVAAEVPSGDRGQEEASAEIDARDAAPRRGSLHFAPHVQQQQPRATRRVASCPLPATWVRGGISSSSSSFGPKREQVSCRVVQRLASSSSPSKPGKPAYGTYSTHVMLDKVIGRPRWSESRRVAVCECQSCSVCRKQQPARRQQEQGRSAR